MKTILKACPCVIRETSTGPEVLIFQHPIGRDFQIPKGTVEEGEDLEDAALRELEEESGIRLGRDAIVAKIGTVETVIPGGPRRELPPEVLVWHLYHLRAPAELESRAGWVHVASGSAEEEGLEFAYSWRPVHEPLSGFYPHWEIVFTALRAYRPQRVAA